jgi:hypothetical protein
VEEPEFVVAFRVEVLLPELLRVDELLPEVVERVVVPVPVLVLLLVLLDEETEEFTALRVVEPVLELLEVVLREPDEVELCLRVEPFVWFRVLISCAFLLPELS